MQSLYRGIAVAEMAFTVSANDEEQAKDFILEMARDEFRDTLNIETKDITKVEA